MKKILPILLCFSIMLSIRCLASVPTANVSTADELQKAIEQAENFGTVYLSGSVSITEPVSLGSSEKIVSLCALDDANIMLKIESNVSFQNINICGSSSSHSSLTVYQISGDAAFENVNFRYTYGDRLKSAYTIEGGTATFSNCSFEGGRAENGGFIYIADGASAILTDTILTNGYASNNGGAIYAIGNLSISGGKIFSCVCECQGAAIWHEKQVSFQDCELFFNESPDAIDIYPELTKEDAEDMAEKPNSENEIQQDVQQDEAESELKDESENSPTENVEVETKNDAEIKSAPSRTIHESQSEKSVIPLCCNSARIDNVAASELRTALTRYFPAERIISREEFAGFLFTILSSDSIEAGNIPNFV